MNRNDWVCVGFRLYGTYLLVEGVLGGLDAMRASGRTSGWLVARLILMLGMGALLFLGAALITGWLQKKDDALARAAHAAATPTVTS